MNNGTRSACFSLILPRFGGKRLGVDDPSCPDGATAVATGKRRAATTPEKKVFRQVTVANGGGASSSRSVYEWSGEEKGDRWNVPAERWNSGASRSWLGDPQFTATSRRDAVRSFTFAFPRLVPFFSRFLLLRHRVPLGGVFVSRDRRDANRSLLGPTNSTHPQRVSHSRVTQPVTANARPPIDPGVVSRDSSYDDRPRRWNNSRSHRATNTASWNRREKRFSSFEGTRESSGKLTTLYAIRRARNRFGDVLVDRRRSYECQCSRSCQFANYDPSLFRRFAFPSRGFRFSIDATTGPRLSVLRYQNRYDRDAEGRVPSTTLIERSDGSEMNPSIGLLTVAVLAIGTAIAGLNPGGADCGEQRCSTVEYCSPYDKRCKPCSSICDATGRNYQQNECIKDCQEYLHDKRYVLLEQYEDLRGQMERLWILAAISIAVAFTSLVSSLYLYVQRCPRWEKMRTTLSRAIAGKRAKRTSNGSGGGDDNDNNNDRGKSTLRDAESGTSRHNGLKLTMPTISASVAPSRFLENENGHGGNGTGSASGSGSANGSGTGNATPNTTTTSLSRRHPSEDTTLDYAYDNPAMTPSPETVQHRTKRESSF